MKEDPGWFRYILSKEFAFFLLSALFCWRNHLAKIFCVETVTSMDKDALWVLAVLIMADDAGKDAVVILSTFRLVFLLFIDSKTFFTFILEGSLSIAVLNCSVNFGRLNVLSEDIQQINPFRRLVDRSCIFCGSLHVCPYGIVNQLYIYPSLAFEKVFFGFHWPIKTLAWTFSCFLVFLPSKSDDGYRVILYHVISFIQW